MSKNYNVQIKEAIEEFLTEDDWNYEPMDEYGVFRMGVNLDCKLKSARVFVNVHPESFAVISVPPIAADEDSKAAAVEFITRANYGMNIGNFEMDYNDGEIRFKTAVLCSDTIPTFEQVKDAIYINVITLERYCDALTMVIYGMMTPDAAIKLVEG